MHFSDRLIAVLTSESAVAEAARTCSHPVVCAEF